MFIAVKSQLARLLYQKKRERERARTPARAHRQSAPSSIHAIGTGQDRTGPLSPYPHSTDSFWDEPLWEFLLVHHTGHSSLVHVHVHVRLHVARMSSRCSSRNSVDQTSHSSGLHALRALAALATLPYPFLLIIIQQVQCSASLLDASRPVSCCPGQGRFDGLISNY